VPANKYSNDIFPVKILEPVALKDLQHEQGSWMEHGKSSTTVFAPLPVSLMTNFVGVMFSQPGGLRA
jgi:hypothetical protein